MDISNRSKREEVHALDVNDGCIRAGEGERTSPSFWALLKEDAGANKVTPLRLKWWFLLGFRMENSCRGAFLRHLGYLLKRVGGIGSGCDFPRGFSCGAGLKLPHMNGVIVSSQASLGKSCKLYHQVTLGISESSAKKGAPSIGDNCVIGAGAKIIDPVIIGNNVKVGANAVVTKDVPSGCTVVGANRVISVGGGSNDIACPHHSFTKISDCR